MKSKRIVSGITALLMVFGNAGTMGEWSRIGVMNVSAEGITGDLNGDGIVDNDDLDMLYNHIHGIKPLKNASAGDVNGDGKLDQQDINYLEGLINKGENRYEIIIMELSWSDAETYCENRGGHLATITSQEEQDYIEALNYYDQSLWIGGYRDDDSTVWKWITGEEWNYENWGSGEPNNSDNVISNENRVAVWPQEWNDLNEESGEQVGFICEWENGKTPNFDYFYRIAGNTLTINKYVGEDGDVTIPDTIEGKTVTDIGENIFGCYDRITSVKIPASVTYISEYAIDSEIYDEEMQEHIPNPIIIKGYRDSAAEDYAKEHNFTFIAIDDDSSTVSESSYDVEESSSIPESSKAPESSSKAPESSSSVPESSSSEEESRYEDDSSIPESSEAEKFNEGTCGEGCTWKLDDKGTLTIIGKGKLGELVTKNGEKLSDRIYSLSLKDVIIEDGITEVGEELTAIANKANSVTFPNSVTKISELKYLKKVICSPESAAFKYFCDTNNPTSELVTADGKKCKAQGLCGDDAYWYMDDEGTMYVHGKGEVENPRTSENPKKIVIGEGITEIADSAFYGNDNSKLKELVLPNSLTKVGEKAFGWNKKLKEVTIPSNVKEIGELAFGWTGTMRIGGGADMVEGFTIKGVKGSAAEKYAKEYGLKFVEIKESSKPLGKGDVNGDGSINVTDIAMVAAHIKGIKALDENAVKAADVNGDGDVNVTDIAKIAAHIKGIKAIG